ncbi:hypothetical protein LY90DRAFT_519226 [Neocallimastix californiae]|uniref:Uncharacterized protein n=1 Tax=Neocallimastix californiae TaxID=1754190 RepID=A0A1Y1Z7I4_9FUNG|nr:hypothetical protein LY90DRAFT_519226 [Neocallimastix californiae]|eukprot:ORY06258.1 hypothetical protein LY90DRAFT_519226 [Neocallimastix californiae]
MDVDTNWCLYCGKKTEGTVYCSKYCHNLDKNKKQRFSNEIIGNPKIQKIHSDIIPQGYNYGTQYSLKFKNRINSCNTPNTRNNYFSIHQYNPYRDLLNNTSKDNKIEKKTSIININEIGKEINESDSNVPENNDNINNFSKISENKEMKIYMEEKIINDNSDMKSTQSPLNYSSFEDLNDDSTTNHKMKNIFSLFYKNNSKERSNETNVKSSTNKEISGISDKYSNFDNSKSLDGSSLIDTSTTHLLSNTEVSSITINSETINSYINSMNEFGNNIKSDFQNKSLEQNNQLSKERNNTVNLRFKNLYLSRRISHKIPAKNIEYLKNFKRQVRRKSNEFGFYASSDEYPATLYTFRQIHAHFPKQFRKMSISLDNQSYKIQKIKDNNCINKNFRDSKKKMEKIHHKKNATTTDYIFTIECLNTITTDENTIRTVKKSGELVENIKNKNNINRVNNNKNVIDTYNDYQGDIIENDANQFITNVEVNSQYEKEFINDNLDHCYTFGGTINMNISDNNLEKQKQDLQQQLIQQIQQQSRYYQENKIDYSYSCTTLSSYESDESYSVDSDDEYEFPDKTNNYYETVIVSPNPMSSITSLSFRKNKDNSVSITASYSSVSNNDLKKLKSLCNNINSTLEQIKVINDIESTSNTPKYDMEEGEGIIKPIERSVQLKKEESVAPLYQNNTLMITTPEIHNVNFKIYDSDATESVTSTSSSTISTESNRDINYLYYDETYQKPFYNLVDYS